MGIKCCQIQNNGDFGVSPFLRKLSDKQCGLTRTLRLVVVIVDQNVGARLINENRCDVAFWHFLDMPIVSSDVRFRV
jgi:hypothetical protein